MKKIISFFIRHEVLVNLGILLIILFGIISATRLTSSFFPEQDTKFIIVEAVYPGASPEEIEEGVTLKIEENLKGITGIDRVTSTSTENSANIQVELLPSADANEVLQEVKNAVDRISSFPPDLERVVVFKQEQLNFTAKLALSGEVPLATLKNKAEEVETELRRYPNISKITLSGFTEPEIEIAVRENLLRTYNLSFQDIARAVSRDNIAVTGGVIRGEKNRIIIRADSKEYRADQLGDVVVKSEPDGRVVRLRQVADLNEAFSENTDRAFFNDTRTVLITVNTTNEEDILQAAESIRTYTKKFNETNPVIKATIVRDYTQTLEERISLLEENGLIGAALVLVILGLFLRVRLAFWVALGIPVSLLGMFILASFYGLTINVLSLFGMILVVGILVDDGVVVGENIFQKHEDGEKPIPAAVNGTMEVLPSIFAAILTTSIAFAFFFLIEGQLGEFFSDVSFVVIAALAVSLVEVILFLPSHLAHSKDLRGDHKPHKLKEKIARSLLWVRDRGYKPLLTFVMHHRLFYFLVVLALLIVTFAAVRGGVVRTAFFPVIEQNNITATLELPAGTSEEATLQRLEQIKRAALALNQQYRESGQAGGEDQPDKIIQDVEVVLGPGGSNQGSVNVYLAKGEDREISSFTIASDLREKAGPIPEATKLSYDTQTPFGKPVSISLSGNNYENLRSAKAEIRGELEKMDNLKDVIDTDREDQPEINIKLRTFAKLLGLDLQQVIGQVRSGFFGAEAQRLQRGDDEVKVWVRYNLDNRNEVEDLREMRIRTPQGNEYPLEEIADIERQQGLIAINHLNGQREISIEADLASQEISAPEVIDNIRANILPGIRDRYPDLNIQFEGQLRETRKLFNSIKTAGPVVLILMIAMLVITFRSFSQAFALLLVIPFGIIGAIWGHAIHGLPVSLLSLLGFIALIGILFNDGLVFVNTFNDELKKGTPFMEAMTKTGLSRFRPIVLTTITTAGGLGPLVLEQSLQAQFLIPMAITVTYGLLLGTFFIATLLPVFLIAVNQAKVYANWLWTGHKPNREQMERAVREVQEQEQYG